MLKHNSNSKILLALGLLSITAAVTISARNPAVSYEVSIYQATPSAVWILFVLALIIAAAGALTTPAWRSSLALGITTILSIVLLPIIRGYYYFGEGDPMGHLGITRDILAGVKPASELLYPALHHYAAIVVRITGLNPRHALMLLVAVFLLPWLLFTPILAREAYNTRKVYLIAAIAAWALLPLNIVNVMVRPHPASMAIFFAPAVIYVFLRYTKTGAVHYLVPVVVLYLASLYLHPQQALNILLVVFVLANGALLVRTQNAGHQSLHGMSVVFALGIASGWVLLASSSFQRALEIIILQVLDPSLGGSAQSQASSLSAIDLTLVDIAVRAGAKYFIFGIAALGALVAWRRNDRIGPEVPLMVLSSIPTLLFIVPFLASGNLPQYARYIGFVMIFGTVLGAIGITAAHDRLELRSPKRGDLATLAVIVLIFVVAVPTIFVSPYLALYGQHVPEGQVDGYETAIEHRSGNRGFVEIRSPMVRYRDAIYGTYTSPDVEQGPLTGSQYSRAPDHFNNHALPEYYDEPVYLGVTRADHVRDAQLYNGFRYKEADFEYLEKDPEIACVVDTGQFDLCLVG
jgi:hypothetical protein